jgi:hypothetical protein
MTNLLKKRLNPGAVIICQPKSLNNRGEEQVKRQSAKVRPKEQVKAQSAKGKTETRLVDNSALGAALRFALCDLSFDLSSALTFAFCVLPFAF